ncbi:MAG: MlaD family protein [Rikenellaceae bacterium]
MRIRKDLKIGVIAIFILALTYWGISFLKGKNLFRSQNSYVAVYDNVADVKVSSAVFFSGVKIGSVTEIRMSDLTAKPSVVLSILKKYKIPANSIAIMKDASMLGGKAIVIIPGNATKYLKDKDTIATQIQMSPLDGIGDMVSGASTALDSLSFTITQINALLSNDNINNISKALADLPQITGNINGMVRSERGNVEMMISNLNGVVKELKGVMPTLTSTLSNIDTLSYSMKNSLPGTLSKVDSILAIVNSDKGTVGLLLHDAAAYNNLNQALLDLQALLVDLKANPKRYVQVSVFGKKDKK